MILMFQKVFDEFSLKRWLLDKWSFYKSCFIINYNELLSEDSNIDIQKEKGFI